MLWSESTQSESEMRSIPTRASEKQVNTSSKSKEKTRKSNQKKMIIIIMFDAINPFCSS